MPNCRLPIVRDGKRVYAFWHDKPEGEAEDVTRCIAEVQDTRGRSVNAMFRWFRQCSRPRGHGPNGLFCRQHATPRRPRDNE